MTPCVPRLTCVNLVIGNRDNFCAVIISRSLSLFTVGPSKLACQDGITER